MSDHGQIWDGNGGTLDPQTAPERSLLVALHYKLDFAINTLADHETRVRRLESVMFRGLGALAVLGLLIGILIH
jgi:hypothetical protein